MKLDLWIEKLSCITCALLGAQDRCAGYSAFWLPSRALHFRHKKCAAHCVCVLADEWKWHTRVMVPEVRWGKKPQNLSGYCFLSCSHNSHSKDIGVQPCFSSLLFLPQKVIFLRDKMRETFNFISEKGSGDKPWTFYSVCFGCMNTLWGEKRSSQLPQLFITCLKLV